MSRLLILHWLLLSAARSSVIGSSHDSWSVQLRACAAAGAGAAACVLLAPPALQTAKGVGRAVRFWKSALPIYLKYRRMQHSLRGVPSEDREGHWSELHERCAPEVLQILLDMRGFYVKVGQVASSVPDMFPGAYIDTLMQLQGQNPDMLARPISEIQKIIRNDLGPRAIMIEDLDPRAIGAAATGQVHLARLLDGSEVVVKVQYPEAERLFRQDFANTYAWCGLLMREYLSYIREVQKSMLSEFDYRREAADLEEIYDRFSDAGNPYKDLIRIPRPVVELSSRNVVVMEYLPGETLLKYALRKKRELEESGYAAGLWRGSSLFRELRSKLELLTAVQGYQIFVDGVFNGDPHPGNVLQMPDGRLGLIDYGNVNRLSAEVRAGLGHLVLALALEDKAAAVAHARRLGYRTRNNDPEILYLYVRVGFDRDDPESMVLPDGTASVNVAAYFEALDRADPMLEVPTGLVMAARNSVLLRGLGQHLGIRLRTSLAWRDFAVQAIKNFEARGGLAPGIASQVRVEHSTGAAPCGLVPGRRALAAGATLPLGSLVVLVLALAAWSRSTRVGGGFKALRVATAQPSASLLMGDPAAGA